MTYSHANHDKQGRSQKPADRDLEDELDNDFDDFDEDFDDEFEGFEEDFEEFEDEFEEDFEEFEDESEEELDDDPPSKESRRRPTRKVGGNDPCPCGSGRKFKACCGP